MSYQAVRWALDDSAAPSAPAVAVLVAVAEHADPAGRNAHPSVARISKRARLSRRQTQAWLRVLEECGDLIPVSRSLRGTTVYELPVQHTAQGCGPPHPSEGEGGSAPGMQETARVGARATAPEPSVEPSENRPSSEKLELAETEKLCALLAELRVANGCKRPPVDRKSQKIASELLGKEGTTWTEVESVLRWSQGDEFWRTVIASVSKFAEHYDTLRLKAQASGHVPPPSRPARPCRAPGCDELEGLTQGYCPPHYDEWCEKPTPAPKPAKPWAGALRRELERQRAA